MLEFLIANKVLILGALLALSEVMALIPGIQSSGIFDLIVRTLKALKGPQA